MASLLIKNGLCVTPQGEICADILVRDQKIARIAAGITDDADETVDAAGMIVLPGVIDTHVHMPWPSLGNDSVDDFRSGSIAGAHGGVTTILEYLVPEADGSMLPTLDKRLDEARTEAFVNYSPQMIIRHVVENTRPEMSEIVRRGFPSFKVFTAYSGLQLREGEIAELMRISKDLGALLCFHAEDGDVIQICTTELVNAGTVVMEHYPQAHPRQADAQATEMILKLAEATSARVHIAHVNTKEGAAMIRAARERGVNVTGETCPHYLMFTEEKYKTKTPEAAYYLVSPAIREEIDRSALWDAIRDDDLQQIATDHCPYSKAQKTANWRDLTKVPGGAGGIELSLPLLYTYGVHGEKFSLHRLAELMSTNPAKNFDLYPAKGLLAEGSGADIVLYDPSVEWQVSVDRLHSRCDISAYEGLRIQGKVKATIVNGKIVVRDGKLLSRSAEGKIVTRKLRSNLN